MEAIKGRKKRVKSQERWTLDQIKAGLYITKKIDNLKIIFQIGKSNSYKSNNWLNQDWFGLIHTPTGRYMHIGSKETLVRYLNENEFISLTKKELINFIRNTDQGFMQKFLVIT